MIKSEALVDVFWARQGFKSGRFVRHFDHTFWFQFTLAIIVKIEGKNKEKRVKDNKIRI